VERYFMMEFRMACSRDRTGVEDIKNNFGETRLKWLRHLETKDEII